MNILKWFGKTNMHGTNLIVLFVEFIANLQVVLHFSWNSWISCDGLYKNGFINVFLTIHARIVL